MKKPPCFAILAAAAVFFGYAPQAASAGGFVSIETHRHQKADYYPWVTFLTRGKPQRLDTGDSPQIRLLSYRVAVLGDDAEVLVYLEEILSGEGDCCRSILSIRRLDLEELCARFEIAGRPDDFSFIGWRSADSFEFKIRRRRFVLEGLGGETVEVKEKAGVGGRKSDVREDKPRNRRRSRRS